MNNLVFFTENNQVKTELQECTPVSIHDDSKLKCFNVDEKPLYLRISYLGEIHESELMQVYCFLIDYKLIEVSESIVDMVKEDFECNKGSMKGSGFEIKCHDFKNVFFCANDIMEFFKEPGMGGWNTERVAVMISDEPSKEFVLNDQREKHAL